MKEIQKPNSLRLTSQNYQIFSTLQLFIIKYFKLVKYNYFKFFTPHNLLIPVNIMLIRNTNGKIFQSYKEQIINKIKYIIKLGLWKIL
jgi:hypothetical protein